MHNLTSTTDAIARNSIITKSITSDDKIVLLNVMALF